jgi:YgiT-type zinc finger domain-containing protein
MIDIKICPSCGSRKIEKVRRRWMGEYKGCAYSVDRLEFHECPDCHEQVFDPEAMRAIEAASPAYAKSVTISSGRTY